MKQETFEEDFPGLKGKLQGLDWDYTHKGISEEDIQKHCLDKIRVKEAIPKIIKLFCSIALDMGVWGDDTEIYETEEEAIKDVEKELGL